MNNNPIFINQYILNNSSHSKISREVVFVTYQVTDVEKPIDVATNDSLGGLLRIGKTKTHRVAQISFYKTNEVHWCRASMIKDFNIILKRMDDLVMTKQYFKCNYSISKSKSPQHNKSLPIDVLDKITEHPLNSSLTKSINKSLKNSFKPPLHHSLPSKPISHLSTPIVNIPPRGTPIGSFAPNNPISPTPFSNHPMPVPSMPFSSTPFCSMPFNHTNTPLAPSYQNFSTPNPLPLDPLNQSTNKILNNPLQPLSHSLPSLLESKTTRQPNSIKSSLQSNSNKKQITTTVLHKGFFVGYHLNETNNSKPEFLQNLFDFIGNTNINPPSPYCGSKEIESILNNICNALGNRYDGSLEELCCVIRFGWLYKKLMNLWDLKDTLINWIDYFDEAMETMEKVTYQLTRLMTTQFYESIIKLRNWKQVKDYNFIKEFESITQYFQ
ncbi:Uncharacterized protein QTN25_008235 [Entamoeba marina]